ncbi:MAG: cation:proton antiporter [archaeon]
MIEIVTSLAVIFIVASIVLFIFNRLNHPTIPAYLIAGIIISPFVKESGILSLAEIGIAFLVFIFGVSLKLEKTERIVKNTALITVAQVTIIGLLVYLYSYIIGLGTLNSLYLAVAASLSSSLVGMELIEGKKIKLAYKRLCNSINLTQDIIAIFIFLILASYPLIKSNIISNVQIGVIILAAGFLVRFLTPYVLEFIKKSQEATMLIGLSVLLIFTTISQHFEISIIIGSFAAGVALSKPPYDQEILETFESLKDFFSAIFFVSLGALIIIPGTITLITALALVFVIVIAKPLFTILILESKGYSKGTSLMTAMNLDQMSEFALILAIHARISNQIEPMVFQAIILAAIITMISSSYTSQHVWKIYDKLKDFWLLNLPGTKFVESKVPEDISSHFIVAGYDIQGTRISKFLKERDQKVVIIDNDPERILEAKEEGMNYIHGDLMIQETWEEARYKKAQMIISTVPLNNITEKIISLDTEAYKIVRAKYLEEARKYIDNVLYVIVPKYLSCTRLIENLKGCLGSEKYRKRLRKISKEELV